MKQLVTCQIMASDQTRQLITDQTNCFCYEMMVQGLLRVVLSPFMAGITFKAEESDSVVRFRPVLQYIEDNLSEPVSVADLADLIHLNPNYFSNRFKEVFGLSPLNFILQQRIEKAQGMLTCTNMQVKKIALVSGFGDQLYFSRAFKKITGLSPSEYRVAAKLAG